MDERYTKVSTPPEDALKPIEGGNLKGKTNIDPQWKIEAMTETYGMCGEGWKFETVSTSTFNCPNGQVLLFMKVNLYLKEKEGWSDPIVGFGGDFIVNKNKNGLVPNDEAYKMCLTDALGNAMRNIGMASAVYRGMCDTKYSSCEEESNIPRIIDVKRMTDKEGIDLTDFCMTLFRKPAAKLTPAQIKSTVERFESARDKYRQIKESQKEEIPFGDEK